MNELFEYLVDPFVAFNFMRRALVACLAMALGCAPLGVLLVLRRMSLMADAMSHAILPGAALAFLWVGFSLFYMSLGGFFAGLTVALLSGVITRLTTQKEDASFAAFYLISLALGVLIVSSQGSVIDLMHLLFGSILAVDNTSLLLLASIASVTLLTLAVIYRPLIVECFDPKFLRSLHVKGWIYHFIFLILVVLNLVAGFQALGTLMVVGLMMLPAAAARFWAYRVEHLMGVACIIALFSGYSGLLLSFHANLPSGPAIILIAGVVYILSVVLGRQGGLLKKWIHQQHLKG